METQLENCALDCCTVQAVFTKQETQTLAVRQYSSSVTKETTVDWSVHRSSHTHRERNNTEAGEVKERSWSVLLLHPLLQ